MAAGNGDEHDFAELRDLLFPERAQIDEIGEHIRNRSLRAGDISEVLPDAIMLRASQDGTLRNALAPTLVEALRTSVRKDPALLADALFPMIGAAVRRAVAAALADMTDSLNKIVESSMSARSIQWRLEAMRTGKSFGEIALTRSLLYRVEQVFLIHGASGLLLQHAMSPAAAVKDPDMVSGMLTAIQDFVHDSFGATENTLEMMRVGEFSVLIQHGPHAILAGVVRGTAPPGLSAVFASALETIHRDYGVELAKFDGEAAPFEPIKSILNRCLLGQAPPEQRKSPAWLYVAGALLLLLLAGVWTVRTFQERQRWNSFVAAVEKEPGVKITKQERSGSRYLISGLRDPLSRDPAQLLAEHHITADRVAFQWESYLSLAPAFAAEREFTRLKEALDRQVVLFAEGQASINPQWVPPIGEQIRRLLEMSVQPVTVELAGHADNVGTEASNQRLAGDRANAMKAALVEYGVDASKLTTRSSVILTSRSMLSRSVTFQVLTGNR